MVVTVNGERREVSAATVTGLLDELGYEEGFFAIALNEEVVKAYSLFTKGEEREINLNDLRRVARDLREDVPDAVLKDMIREATGGGFGSVGMEDFEGVMKRAGVFS